MTFPSVHDDRLRIELLKAARTQTGAWQQRFNAATTIEELAALVTDKFKGWYFDHPDASRFELRIIVDMSMRERIASQGDGQDLFPGALIAALQKLTPWEVFQGNSRLNTGHGVVYNFIIREPQAS